MVTETLATCGMGFALVLLLDDALEDIVLKLGTELEFWVWLLSGVVFLKRFVF